MLTKYVAEFAGTVIFAAITMIVVTALTPLFLIALCVGLALALGIWVCLLLGGPGYLNPVVAVLVGVKDNKSTLFTGGMVLAEFLAATLVLVIYFAARKSH